ECRTPGAGGPPLTWSDFFAAVANRTTAAAASFHLSQHPAAFTPLSQVVSTGAAAAGPAPAPLAGHLPADATLTPHAEPAPRAPRGPRARLPAPRFVSRAGGPRLHLHPEGGAAGRRRQADRDAPGLHRRRAAGGRPHRLPPAALTAALPTYAPAGRPA